MLAVPLVADTQQPAKIPKIGVLEPGPPPTDALMLIESSMFSTYSDRLAELALAHRLPTITAIAPMRKRGASSPIVQTILICAGAPPSTWTSS